MPNKGTQLNDAQEVANTRLAAIYGLIRHGQFEAAFQLTLQIDARVFSNIDDANEYHFLKGRCLYGLGMYQDAITAFMGVQGWQQQPQALNALAYCYQKLGHHDVADELFDKESTCLLLEIGQKLLNEGAYYKALKVFRAIPDWRNSKDAIEGLELAYINLGLHERARGLRRLIELKWPESRDLQTEYHSKVTQSAMYPRFFLDRKALQDNSSQNLQALDLQESDVLKRKFS